MRLAFKTVEQQTSQRTLEKMEKTKPKIEKKKKVEKKIIVIDELTDEEREAVTIVFHQYETGLREGTILVKVCTITRFVTIS